MSFAFLSQRLWKQEDAFILAIASILGIVIWFGKKTHDNYPYDANPSFYVIKWHRYSRNIVHAVEEDVISLFVAHKLIQMVGHAKIVTSRLIQKHV